MDSDASDAYRMNAKRQVLSIREGEPHSLKGADRQFSIGKRGLFNASSSGASKGDQRSAPERSTDIGWEHGRMVNGDRQKVKCKYCSRILSGGVSRFKQHLAGKTGHVSPCENVPDNVKLEMKLHLSNAAVTRGSPAKRRGSSAKRRTGKLPISQVSSRTRSISHSAFPSQECIDNPSPTQHFSEDDYQGNVPNAPITRGSSAKRTGKLPVPQVSSRSQSISHSAFPSQECVDNQSPTEHFSKEDYAGSISNTPVTRGSSAKRRTGKLHVPQVSSRTQSTLQSAFSSQECVDLADLAVAKFMHDAGIPINAANSCYFQRMADKIAAAGPGYKMPSYHSLQGRLLEQSAHEVGEVCKEIRQSWKITGCTVMVDRWKVRSDRIVINFFVYCPKGTMLLKSIDASNIDNYHERLLSLFDDAVQEVGPCNVVNFVTDTTPSYKAAGKELMCKYKTFFWSTCANHTIELVLEELSKLVEVKEVFAKAKRICQFIYNNTWVLNLMKKETGGRDIFLPAMTEFVTKFLTLDSMLSLKDSIRQMFTGTLWEESTFSKQSAGKGVAQIVSNPEFWLLCTKVMEVSSPLLTVLHLVDSEDNPSIGYLYDAMEKAMKGIIMFAFGNMESESLDIIDCAIEELCSPLYAAACYLNPSIYYSPNFSMNFMIEKVLLNCIETLEPDLTAQDNIRKQKAFYENKLGDFSRPLAIRGRETLPPATWWSQYASDYPDLQRFAVRILSQACSITTSEKNRAINEFIRSRNNNRLEQERLNKLAFVHQNLHLQQQVAASGSGKSGVPHEHDVISLEGRNSSVGEWIEDPGVVERGCR